MPVRVDQGLGLGREIGKIGWGADDDAVCGKHFFYAVINDIVLDRAALVFVVKTLHTGCAAVDVFTGQLNKLCRDSLFFQFRQNFFD